MSETRGDRIEVTCRHSGEIAVVLPFNPIYIEKLKEIEGHRWNPEQKCPKDPYGLDILLI